LVLCWVPAVEDLEFALHLYQDATRKADENTKLAVLKNKNIIFNN
jgi:hypothetical protein